MNICVGGDLAGQVVEFDKRFFNAKEVEENKTSEYYKQRYIVGDAEYRFWISKDMKLCDATDQAEVYIRKPKN